MSPKKSKKKFEEKSLAYEYCNRVLVGNWYESSKLAEYKLNNFLNQMKSGDLLLARYRKMNENMNSLIQVTAATGAFKYGSIVCLYAPHVPASDPPSEKKGLLLGGRLNYNEIVKKQDLTDGCAVVGLTYIMPTARNAFRVTSPDYCNRDNEYLKYNEEFMLTLASSVDKKPLYVRFDPNPIPGLNGMYPLYLSEHPVSSCRWRALPVQRPDITRFELEGTPVNVNEDVVINHCSTNINLGINLGCWALGFNGKICGLQMKTCLDIFGRELPNNIWQFYVPYSDADESTHQDEINKLIK